MIIHPESVVALSFSIEDGVPLLLSALNENGEDQLPGASAWQVARWEWSAREAMEEQRGDGVVARWERAIA